MIETQTIMERFTQNAEQFDALMVEMLEENNRLRKLCEELTVGVSTKCPASKISIEDMCEIIRSLGIEKKEYTDCTIVYEVTFEQLRAIYNMARDYGE
jgi:hypothetical protein